jgi:hypothetical protein
LAAGLAAGFLAFLAGAGLPEAVFLSANLSLPNCKVIKRFLCLKIK